MGTADKEKLLRDSGLVKVVATERDCILPVSNKISWMGSLLKMGLTYTVAGGHNAQETGLQPSAHLINL